jgi:hypothetical protein
MILQATILHVIKFYWPVVLYFQKIHDKVRHASKETSEGIPAR